jgi:transcription elongation factor GreA-like protein
MGTTTKSTKTRFEGRKGMELILKPHPSTKRGQHEYIDIFHDSTVPWASVYVDMFWEKDNRDLYDALYKEGRTLKVKLEIVEG